MLRKWEIRYIIIIILTCVMVSLVTLLISSFYLRTQLNDMHQMLETIQAEHHQFYPNPPNDIK